MKKILLSVLMIAFVAVFAHSQSFQLIHDGEVFPNGGSFIVGGEASALLVANMAIKNVSAIAVQAKIRKFEVDIIPGSSNTFCWGLCFPPFVFESPSALNIEPGAVCNEFSGDYTPTNFPGVSIMRYTVFNINQVNDSAYFFVEFNAGTVGITNNTNNKISVSNPYPNPAKSQTSFNYTLPANASSASIRIHNLLGAVVKEVQMNGQNGKVTINVGDLNDGVYFYSVVLNNETYETKRLVISR